MNEEKVELGYIEIPEHPWILHRCYFPSKVGGLPAWLNPERLPNEEIMLCAHCKNPMVFLLQLYAPNQNSSFSFHRTVFVFCCKNGSCYQEKNTCPMKVVRCCLPRSNKYYKYDPPDYESPNTAENCEKISKLCAVCGCQGKKYCSRCKTTNYCSKNHQVLDWKHHKLTCGSLEKPEPSFKSPNRFLFPEYELVIEHEADISNEPNNINEASIKAASSIVDSERFSEEELLKNANLIKEDETFVAFKDTISAEPEQVVRYQKHGSPLWCSKQNQPNSEDIPPCQCGSKRKFEFQIMPHILTHLDVDTTVEGPSIDWGTVAVYTCLSDCVQADIGYHSEFAWRQSYSE